MKRRPRSLQRLLESLSQSHFGRRLGGYTVRRTPLTLASIERSTAKGVHRFGETFPWHREIRIAGVLQLRPILERRVLLHEMCHAAAEDETLFGGLLHGPSWRAEMYRLAREHGESWAERDAQRYEQSDVEAPGARSRWGS